MLTLDQIEKLKKQIPDMSKEEASSFYFGYVYSGMLRDDNNAKAFAEILDLLTLQVFGVVPDDDERFETAVEVLREIIENVHGIKPREYAVSGKDGVITINYAPGDYINFHSTKILQDRDHVLKKLAVLEFKPVWRETETGQERIYA